MKSQVYSHSSLARRFVANDFFKDSRLRDDEAYKSSIIEAALSLSTTGVVDIILSKTTANGKPCYSTTNLCDKILFRLCARYLKEGFRIFQKNRNRIIDELVNFLKDASALRVYRLDIKSFYESCDRNALRKLISENSTISYQTKYLIESFLELCDQQAIKGIPRGIEVSSILAEISIREIDKLILKEKDVVYYSRYVDDIIVVTTGAENEIEFLDLIDKYMAARGHRLNREKQEIVNFEKVNKTSSENSFEFLGYNFTVSNTGGKHASDHPRNIEIDISDDKLRKIKRKICKAFYSYGKTSDFKMLLDRLTFLSTNRKLRKNRDPQVLTGIFYNYSRINKTDTAIKTLDYFVLANVTSTASRIARTRAPFTSPQKSDLLKISFIHGHKNRVFREFSPFRAHKIGIIWK